MCCKVTSYEMLIFKIQAFWSHQIKNTATIWIPDLSGIKMVGIWMGVWKPDWKSLFMAQNVVFKWSAMSHDFAIWIPDTHLQFLEEFGIQVLGIQMVTVNIKSYESQINRTQSCILLIIWKFENKTSG